MNVFAQILPLWLGSLLLFCGIPAAAQERTLYWEKIDVQIEILKDGSLEVGENLEYVFDGAWRGGVRTLALKGLDSISDIRLWEGDLPYRPGGLSKYQYQVSKGRKGVEVRWRCRNDDEPPFAHAHKTFLLRYHVKGALHHYRNFDQLHWKAIFEDRDGVVRQGRATVHLPVPVAKEDLRGDLFAGSQTSRFFRVDDQTVAFEGDEIPPRALFEILVQFPPGIVERHFYWGRFLRERISSILPLFFPMAAFLLLFFLFWHKGRDYRVEEVASYLKEPPSDLRPALAGTLIDEKADMKEILATIVDLARRGYVEMTEKKTGQWLFTKTELEMVLRKAPDQALMPFEQDLLNNLFSHGREGSKVSLSDLKDSFYKHLSSLKDQIYEAALTLKFFERDPRAVVRKYLILGILLLVPGLVLVALDAPPVAFMLFWCMGFAGIPAFILFKSAKEGKWGAVLFLSIFVLIGTGVAITVIPTWIVEYGLGWMGGAGLGLLLSAPVIFAFAPAMPRRTIQGSQEKARWMAFYRYLKEIVQFRDQASGKNIFERYLPYAIAFGVEREWTARFSGLEVAPPAWYQSHYYGDRGWTASPTHWTGHGGSGSEIGEGLHMASLQSMSDGLFSSLNSLSSALCSAPSSSGGSAGGGGGGGGGGGSGGGSGGGW
jgi:uncharacterized membrane protein YgcG